MASSGAVGMGTSRSRRGTGTSVLLVAASLTWGEARAEAPEPVLVSLRDCAIVMAGSQPPFVRRALQDLQAVFHTYAGRAPKILEPSEDMAASAVIRIGPSDMEPVRSLIPPAAAPETFAAIARQEGSREHPQVCVYVGAIDPAGLKFGIVELIRLFHVGGGEVKIRVPVQIARAPRFAMRGMYAHLHWSYNRPYSLRAWQTEDWKRYIDLLTHLGYNSLQIWPMMELLPHPLSAEDEAYLKRYAELVDYAHEQRGMKVFLGSCANNITEDAKGVPIAKREYVDLEKRLDPARPENLKRILEYRSDLYRTIPQADGYWMIDSDPGGWKGSPSSEFVDILIGHRDLIDRYGRRPAEQPLIYWMWYGWGTDAREKNWRTTLADMKARLKEPWRLHACAPPHLDACREMGVLDKAIYFPYGTLEDEPSAPVTELRFPRIQEAARVARHAGLTAIQGNTQTPLVQLPNLVALSAAAWGQDAAQQEGTILRELANRIVCRDADLLARAWQSIARHDADESLAAAEQLHRLAKDESARGTLAIVLGDWQPRILDDLASLLTIHANAVLFAREAAAGRDDAALVRILAVYLDSFALWLEYTGYHDRYLVPHEPYRDLVADALSVIREKRGTKVVMTEVIAPALAEAKKRHDPNRIDAILKSILEKGR